MPSSILTNALASTSSSSITVVSLVEAVVKGIASGSWTTALGSFFSFIAGAIVKELNIFKRKSVKNNTYF